MSSLKSLYQNNKSGTTVSKYLKSSSPDSLGSGVESQAHLDALVEKNKYFLPPVDYALPENFVKFGSAEKYYKNAFEYIASDYPYDGSGLEKTNFYNEINPLEKYMLEVIYPRSTGHVLMGVDYGPIGKNPSGYNYIDGTAEYINIKGGPHRTTKFNEDKDRTSNLEFGGPNGTTLEFFLNKSELIDVVTQSDKMAIFDLTNGVPVANSSSADYGRMRVSLVSGSETQFFVTMLSGTNGFLETPVPSTPDQITISDGKWRNFSFVFNTDQQPPVIDFYVNGTCIETGITASAAVDIDGTNLIGQVTGTMIGNIGALRTAPDTFGDVDPAISEGDGKLTGSIDEFRFWKKARNAEQIGRHWFTNVNGGSDKYDANVSLGVYFPFNEGITLTSSIDKVILDYSGRISNGNFVGYTAAARSTSSAINELEIQYISERGDPIVRTSNPLYISLKSQYEQTGSVYDYNNSARLMNHLPNWIIEQDEQSENEISNITQVISSYFDTLYNQLTALRKLKYNSYVSGTLSDSIDEFPFNDRLIENYGLNTPELFENADLLSQFFERDEQINFDQQLVDIKNSIYKNIYNNLNFILKSKGNEKSIRNFIRCLGVGENILAFNSYSDNTDFQLTSSYNQIVSDKKYVDFTALLNQTDNDATVYQYYNPLNADSVGVITGSTQLDEYAFTAQGEFIFPNKDRQRKLPYTMPQVISSSLFGFHTPADTHPTSSDMTWITANDDYGLQVYAVKSPGEFAEVTSPDFMVKDAYFVVENRAGDVLLTSSIFRNVYDNQKWNLSLYLKPKKYPFSNGVLGTEVATSGYELGLVGMNYDTGVQKHTFTSTVDVNYLSGSSTVGSAKKIYTGAHRTNFTGSSLISSDVRVSSIRYWTDYLPPETLNIQAKEVDTHGVLHPSRNSYLFQTASAGVYIPNIQTLALNWEFSNVTGSDLSGQFIVQDESHGLASDPNNYLASYQGPVFSELNLRQHSGRGDFYAAGSTPVRKQYVYTDKLLPPDYIDTNEMIKTIDSEIEVFGTFKRPSSTFFAIEKSVYRGISDRMLELFASIEDFNNLIGEPVNRYRMDYKQMEKLREIFFRKVQNDIVDLQKYLDYYKWLDSAMNRMLDQLMPASARYAPNVRNVVESHTLERNKIQYRFPILRPAGGIAGVRDYTGDVNGPNTPIGVGGDPGEVHEEQYPPQRPNDPNPNNLGGNILVAPEQINAGRLQDYARNYRQNPEDIQVDPEIDPDLLNPNFG